MTKNHLKLTIELEPAGRSAGELWQRLLPNLKKKIERQLFEREGEIRVRSCINTFWIQESCGIARPKTCSYY